MHKALAQSLDWCSIQLCRRAVRDADLTRERLAEAEARLRAPDLFGGGPVAPPGDWQWRTDRRFQFTSASTKGLDASRNSIVPGRIYVARPASLARPTMVMLHGWNAEAGYYTLFPWLARRLNAAGINAAMFELPFHGQRKPARNSSAAPTNFLSGDLLHVIAAVQQAVADARALISWLRSQGCEQVGVWGVSLGAYLTGVLACVEPRLAAAVLLTPVVRIDRLIAEVSFCAPLRRSLRGSGLDLAPMNLMNHTPRLVPDNILLAASEHDLFAPIATVEELCVAWQQPHLWRRAHGHISVLLSVPLMTRVVRFVKARF